MDVGAAFSTERGPGETALEFCGAEKAAKAGAHSAQGFPVIIIGSSSGGPTSLRSLLSGLPEDFGAAILVAQHMPSGFTKGFTQRLARQIRIPVREARAGDSVSPGEVLVGPGGRNLVVELDRRDGTVRVALEPADGQLAVPSIDRLLETAATAFGARVFAFVLTGMGRDGAAGVRAVAAVGGRCVAESSETATVFGMPREAAATGCVDAILPLGGIAARLLEIGRPEGGPADAEARRRDLARRYAPGWPFF